MTFAHLHLHSEYSLLDGAIRLKDLPPRLKELGMEACALTDHGFCGGLIEFQKKMKKEGLKPILGCEVYVTEDRDNTPQDQKNRDNLHAVILCKNNKGLRGLFKLLTEAATSNFYYKPRIHRPKLEELAGNVVITTACLKGILAGHFTFERNEYGVVQYLRATQDKDRGPELWGWYRRMFPGDFYIELQDWDDETHIQSCYNKAMQDLIGAASHSKYPSPGILTSDCHYLKAEDHKLHEIMIANQLSMTLENYLAQEAMRYGPHFYLKDLSEMEASAKKWGIDLEVTQEIADKCEAEIELGTYHPPVFRPEEAPDYQEFLKWKEKNSP